MVLKRTEEPDVHTAIYLGPICLSAAVPAAFGGGGGRCCGERWFGPCAGAARKNGAAARDVFCGGVALAVAGGDGLRDPAGQPGDLGERGSEPPALSGLGGGLVRRGPDGVAVYRAEPGAVSAAGGAAAAAGDEIPEGDLGAGDGGGAVAGSGAAPACAAAGQRGH